MVLNSEVFPAQWVPLKGLAGLMVPIPNSAESHLAHFYGTDWRTPKTENKGTMCPRCAGRTAAVEEQYHRLCTHPSTFHAERHMESNDRVERAAALIRKSGVSKAEQAAETSWDGVNPSDGFKVHLHEEQKIQQKRAHGQDAVLAIDGKAHLAYVKQSAQVMAGASPEIKSTIPDPVDDNTHAEAKDYMERAVAKGLLVALVFAGWLVRKAWSVAGRSAPLSFTAHELTFAALYVILSASSSLAIRQTHSSALQQTVEACLLLYVMKAAISLVLLVVKRSMPFTEIAEVLQQRSGRCLPVWCHLAFIGALFATYDTLSFIAFQKLPPVTSQLLLNCRIIFMVPVQRRLIGKKISLVQLSALFLIALAACSLASADIFSFDTVSELQSKHDYMIGIALIISKVLLSGLGLVINEVSVKELPLTVDAQNLITYCFGMAFLAGSMGVRSSSAVSGSSVEQKVEMVWEQIFTNKWMICAVLLMAALGIVCAYLLKAFSAMEKEFMSQGVVALLALGQALTPGEHGLPLLSAESGLIIVLCCIAYRVSDAAQPEGTPCRQEADAPRSTALLNNANANRQ